MEKIESSEKAFRDEFAGRVKTTSLEELPALLTEMIDRPHDYGSICVALGIAAATTAWAMNKHPNAGITGLQAGFVAWEMLRHWGSLYPGACGGRMQDFDNLLYPAYADKFTTIPKANFEDVQEKARDLLKKHGETGADHVHPDVWAHWNSIASGDVPFGLSLSA